jgi:recombination protein RecR
MYYEYFVSMSESDAKETLIENLIGQLAGLPSIGRKTAQRLAYHLLAQDSGAVNDLARTLTEAKSRIHACASCGNYTERDLCRICANPRRQQNLICVVEKPGDILAFERSGTYQGVYHVLGGSISPLDGVGPADLNFARLWERGAAANGNQTAGAVKQNAEAVKQNAEAVKQNAEAAVELILALNTNAEGEATATFIVQKLQGASVKISRLARGIPVGSELEYVDELTVQRALESRVEIG